MWREEYARRVAGWVGWADVAQVIGRVREEAQKLGMPARSRRGNGGAEPAQLRQPRTQTAAAARPDPVDPTLWPQREALKSVLQYPALAGPVFDSLTVESFTHPGSAAVRGAIGAARRPPPALPRPHLIPAPTTQPSAPA